MKQSSVNNPLAFFRWYFRNRIEYDRDQFVSEIIEEVVCGVPHEINENKQEIKVLNSSGNWDSYSFGSYLRRKLSNEIEKSLELMDEYIINNTLHDLSVAAKAINLSRLIDRVFSDKIIVQYPYLQNVYGELKDYVSSLMEGEQESSGEFEGPTYFRVKEGVEAKHFNRIYDLFKEQGIIDFSKVKPYDFQRVFLAKNPSEVEKPIVFVGKSLVVCNALCSMEVFFYNFKPKIIETSGLFKTKLDHPITESNLNTCKSRLRKNKIKKNQDDFKVIADFLSGLESEIF